MKIGNRDTKKRVFIIAEIGNNHEGNIENALSLVDAAADSGADAIKFQMINPEELVSFDQNTRMEQLRKFSLTKNEFRIINERAKEKQVLFMATPFYVKAVSFLNDFVPAFKIASSDIDFFPLIKSIAKTGKPIIISCGIASKKDMKNIIQLIEDVWKNNGKSSEYAFLNCISKYPTMPQEAKLNRLKKIKKLSNTVGYSDHTIGIEACLASVTLGAEIIEKHFTLDNNFSSFQDHKLSANPVDFKKMVERIRNLEILLSGKSSFGVSQKISSQIRRVAATSKDLKSGQKIIADHLMWVRPGKNNGISISAENTLKGKVLRKDYKKGEILLSQDLK